MKKEKFVFELSVEIPKDEVDDFYFNYINKKFDFFRYLADNGVEFNMIKCKKLEDDEQ